MNKVSLSLPAIRCLSKEEAAQYLGIGVTLLSELDIPCIKIGRRSLYDRVDLDAWIEEYKQGEHERAKKEAIWPKPKRESTGDKILASGGLQQRSKRQKNTPKRWD